MRNQLSKIVLIAAAVILSVVFLYPTYQDYQYRKSLVSLTGKDSLDYYEKHQEDIRAAKEKRIKLGLDLQGGMRVVLEVNVIQLLGDVAKNKDDNFHAIMTEFKAQTSANDETLIPSFTKKFTDRGIR
ncbi:MAG: protein translocase subunit SecD, partial [Ignavibacteriales bacterium]|nr:protein translocase subunit SecD [Ignavibacteriales bacterium]